MRLDKSSEAFVIKCLDANGTVEHVFQLAADIISKVNVSVTVEIDPTYPGHCGPEILLNVR